MLADEPEIGFVDATRTHPIDGAVGVGHASDAVAEIPRTDVAVRQTADAVEQFDVAQVARPEDLFDRERRGQEVERFQRAAGAEHLRGLFVATPQMLGQIGDELVGDDELRRGQRFDAAEREMRQVVVGQTWSHAVGALLERDEAHLQPVGRVAHHHAEIGQRVDEQRVADAEKLDAVFGDARQFGDRDDECGRGLTAERAGRVGIDRVQHDVRARPGLVDLAVPGAVHRADKAADEPLEHRAGAEVVARKRLGGVCGLGQDRFGGELGHWSYVSPVRSLDSRRRQRP